MNTVAAAALMNVSVAMIERFDHLAKPHTPCPLVQPEPIVDPTPTIKPANSIVGIPPGN